jgi:hypothetical protein
MRVKWMALLVTLCVFLSAVAAQDSAPPGKIQEKPVHNREFWRAIANNGYRVPAGEPVFPLVRELSGYLGSSDPELRDTLTYSIIATWIVDQKQLSPNELDLLLDEWRGNLRAGIGESGNDSVLKRSFSALCLAALAERDLKTPFLGEERYRTLLADALAYLKDERDLRGFDPAMGWIHATAHTADLLASLANNPLLKVEDQGRLLDAISERLSSAHGVVTYEEQDRLALVASAIIRRRDFDPAVFQRWLKALDAAGQNVFKDSPPKVDLLHTFENDTYMLRGLAVDLCMGPSSPAISNAQNTVLQVLKTR